MGAPLLQLHTLVVPPPVAAPLGINDELPTERGPPCSNLAPPVSYLPVNFAYWENTFLGPVLPGNMPLPPPRWKTAAKRLQNPTVQTILAALDALPPTGNLNITPLN